MKKSSNKKFLYKVGTRLWGVYTIELGNPRTWRVNAEKIKGWIYCTDEDRKQYPRTHKWASDPIVYEADCASNCKAGAMLAKLAGGINCVCNPTSSNVVYHTELEMKELVERGEILNYKIDRNRNRYSRHGRLYRMPKVWEKYKEGRAKRKEEANGHN